MFSRQTTSGRSSASSLKPREQSGADRPSSGKQPGHLRAHFRPTRFEQVARFDQERQWIDIRLRSSIEQVVRIDGLGLEVRFGEGEGLRTEISAKFRRAGLETELEAAGFDPRRWWTDSRGDFALSLSFAD